MPLLNTRVRGANNNYRYCPIPKQPFCLGDVRLQEQFHSQNRFSIGYLSNLREQYLNSSSMPIILYPEIHYMLSTVLDLALYAQRTKCTISSSRSVHEKKLIV